MPTNHGNNIMTEGDVTQPCQDANLNHRGAEHVP